eukprot:COSAG02_NODE_10422_length_1944_cov_10.509055_2_plen_97_part_00
MGKQRGSGACANACACIGFDTIAHLNVQLGTNDLLHGLYALAIYCHSRLRSPPGPQRASTSAQAHGCISRLGSAIEGRLLGMSEGRDMQAKSVYHV